MRSSGAMLSCNSVFSHDINYTESSNDSTELICKSITIFCEKDFIEKSEKKTFMMDTLYMKQAVLLFIQ